VNVGRDLVPERVAVVAGQAPAGAFLSRLWPHMRDQLMGVCFSTDPIPFDRNGAVVARELH
jgi:hypothetical protein